MGITSSFRLRSARNSDLKSIQILYDKSGFTLDALHLECLFVVEDKSGIVAAGSLSYLLEASFVVDSNRSRRVRVTALTALIQQAQAECRNIGFDNYHVFATNDMIIKILKNKFNFIKTNAKQVLLKWIR